MSGLAALLAGRQETGVYRWHSNEDVDAVEHVVELAEWTFAYVDGWTHPGDSAKAAFLDAIGEALGFPDYYGRNLDALSDCLSEISAPTVVLWDGWTTLARADTEAFRAVVEIFSDRERLALLLRGDGPEISEVPLRSLD